MSGTASVLTLHPEAVPGDLRTLRWVVPADVVPFEGCVARAPGDLGQCLSDGTLSCVTCENAAVLTTLGRGASWEQAGARVRAALQRALAARVGWAPEHAPDAAAGVPDSGARERVSQERRRGAGAAGSVDVAAAVRRVLDGPAGAYVRSHGGKAELVCMRDGYAEIRLVGACAHCPASAATLKTRLEAEILAQVPQVVGVREAPGGLRRTWARLSRAGGGPIGRTTLDGGSHQRGGLA